jgi:hypothetical protein
MFKYDGTYFTNMRDGRVVAVDNDQDIEATPVNATERTGSIGQQWKVVYKDKVKDDQYGDKGELDKYFGLKVDEPFYLRSRLPMQRVIECVSAANAVLKKWASGRVAQTFYFDGISKTIKSKYWTGYSMEYYNGKNLRFTGTNSRWFQLFRW